MSWVSGVWIFNKPMIGPTTEQMEREAAMIPVYRLRLRKGKLLAMMMNAPPITPAPPAPAIALPMIKEIELGAAPQTALPIKKMRIDVKYVHFVLSKVYARPNGNWKAQVVIKNAALYQDTSLIPPSLEVMTGKAVARMVPSIANKNVVKLRETRISSRGQ